MKRAIFALIVILFFLAYGYVFAQMGVTANDHGIIKGIVTDTQTPRPNRLHEATVTVESHVLLGDRAITATTDIAGNYEVTNVPPGEYVVTVSKRGYDDSMDYVTVTPGGEVFHDVRLYKTDTLITYFWKMGPVRWPLLLCSQLMWMAMLAGLIYLIMRISKLKSAKSKVGKEFMYRVRAELQNGDVLAAISACDEVRGLASILKAGLLKYAELRKRGEVAAEGIQKVVWMEKIQEGMEKASFEAKSELRFHWSLIGTMFATIGGMAMLYGILGTTTGVIRSLTAIALKGTGDIQLLAGGLGEAALASTVGLSIAIPAANLLIIAFIVYKIFENSVDKLVSRTRGAFADLIGSLSSAEQ